jgi:signal transduction histidine kinase/integral membrane sensor domain MASE1/ActR/RegA family two-component response regulator
VLVAFGYFACAAFSGFFTHWTSSVSYIWLPSGWYVGALILTKPRHWLLMVVAAGIGDICFNLITDPWPISLILLSHVGNSAAAVTGAWLVRRFTKERPTLTSVHELVVVIGLAGCVSLLVAAGNGALLLHWKFPDSIFSNSFIAWYSSDLLGVILLTPAVLAWQRGARRSSGGITARRILEYSLLLTGVCVVTASAFYFHWLRQTETLYVAAPFIIWAALRFGLRGATITILITAVLAQWFTALGYGSVGSSTLTTSQKSIEVMVSLGVFAIVGLLPATVFSALKAAQAREAVRSHSMTLVAMGAKLPAILDSIVLGVEAEQPAGLCSILLLDEAGTHLLVGSAPSLPSFYNDAIHGVGIGANVGSCGTAAFLNQRVIVEDIQTDPRWMGYRELAAKAGLASCWSEPFYDPAGRLLGTFAVYHRYPCAPTSFDIDLIVAASQIAAIATERKQLEDQFLRAQRMESIGTLAGGIAHDFNNLLTPIVMSAGLLRESESDPDNQDLLKTIELSARRGASLVRQILTFARGAEGSRVVLNMGLIVNELQAIAANTFPKNIIFSQDIARELPLVMGDRTQLEQVLLNLCVNARDAMPDGGRLTIRGRERRVDEKSAAIHPGAIAGQYVEIEVTDTGCGMTPEVVQRIFEPFYTSKEMGRGTGLGLSTALGITRSHGGFINVASKTGQGSTFKIYLPALAAGFTVHNELEKVESLIRGDGELVLLVDDEPVILKTTTQVLVAFGYRVIVAGNGVEALELVKLHRSKIGVVVTDMMMPVMDGRELVESLRNLEPDLPVITVSGLKAEKAIAGTGVKYHLPKPYSADGLLSVLAKVLGKTVEQRVS